MANLLSDLVNDLVIVSAAVNEAQRHQKEASDRLRAGLSLIGSPINAGGSVVIGNSLIKLPYESLPLVVTPIENLNPYIAVTE